MFNSLKKLTKALNQKYTLGLFLLLYFGLLVYINSTYSFIGRGDYANYANVARNLLSGKGFSVDYLAFHYINYNTLTHPEDMWPILQPVFLAISFFFLGITPFAARLPNAIFLTALVALTYFFGQKLFNKKVALVASILTGLNSSLIVYSTTWITSDIFLALLSLIIFYLGYRAILSAQEGKLSLKLMVGLGILSGLAILQKPMGALFPFVYFLILFFYYRRNIPRFVTPGLIFIASTLLISGGFFIRNFILFGTFLLPTEHYLGYLIKYFPYENIFRIYYDNPPNLSTWLNYGLLDFLKVNFSYFRYSVDTFIYKDLLVPYTVIIFSLIEIYKIQDKRKYFFLPIICLISIMTLLMGTYWHYESRYYAMFIPVLNMLAVSGLLKIVTSFNLRSVLLILTLGFITFIPSAKAVFEGVKPKITDPSLIVYNWIRENTPRDSVITTLTPWELNFHAERKTITIPFEDKETILWMAKKYNSNYLELEFLNEIKRPSLKELYSGQNTNEFSKIYQVDGKIYLYQINWQNITLDEKGKPSWY
ncbi:MAG: hypothetical protein A3F33_03610 [Candidatus Woykebacteria bacterium RIFCSPHIGHO2_12_FULL_43_10]|uniref:Glycosyltransferase RgtA/B/C/D-like domain-containing protein n=1 Tax=Candidatus Woykebacteria bacterium RIFCSPHIGHO2_02_FULL_43_16b TaxID=1802601 RepID=A0A1G1WQT6_9BACT|nr:MAG: hypothetical protein A3J50_03320 [Candidatus Woykebacteria bacterium RIFCSPHIGHO2_02_FULL_43_16b]OGY30221.1 MAG: hypothetical protein A3F33_03610 [Candidatus Woykebacteria bacterium RIFCSPHIGHO2_12_FULL_43_10]